MEHQLYPFAFLFPGGPSPLPPSAPTPRGAPRRPSPAGGGDGSAAGGTWTASHRWAAAPPPPPPAQRRGSRSWSSPPCRAAPRCPRVPQPRGRRPAGREAAMLARRAARGAGRGGAPRGPSRRGERGSADAALRAAPQVGAGDGSWGAEWIAGSLFVLLRTKVAAPGCHSRSTAVVPKSKEMVSLKHLS